MHPLPVDAVLPRFLAALRDTGSAVLQAPPGAGKTTRVPLALLDEPWLAGRRVVVLEPRRLAARAAATFMARALGEEVGATVGYRVRMETRAGPRTRIEVVTEGVLTRMMQSDPGLEGIGAILFDEIHERSVHADLGLALALQSRALFRPELRVAAMSATLDSAPLAALLGDAPVVTSEGRTHPVETRYLPRPAEGPVDALAARAVREALAAETGDLLVFLPGAAEIRRTADRLEASDLPPEVRVHPLHGALSQQAQDDALAPAPPERRKVVLATSIAETSLTLEGVRVVVDAGRMRVPRFSPRTGMTRLETVPVSRASADQRRGRAGRLGPGVCYRLWTEAEDAGRPAHGTPEIREADLAPLALELAVWGAAPEDLAWLDPPPSGAFAQARELLAALGALDAEGAATAHGREMATLAAHPRLAHMLLRGRAAGVGGLACDLAALLSERDVLRRGAETPEADLRLRLDALGTLAATGRTPSRADPGALRRALAEARGWRRRLRAGDAAGDPGDAGALLALAYPERVGRRRGAAGRYLLRGGRGAALPAGDPLGASEWIVAAELDDRGRESRVYLGAPLERETVERLFGEAVERRDEVVLDPAARAVRARRVETLGAIVLREAPLPHPDPGEVAAALLAGIAAEGVDRLPWAGDALRLRARLAFLHHLDPSWPDVSDAALGATLDGWLGPHLHGLRALDDLRRVDLAGALRGLPGWARSTELDRLAPTHVEIPSGARIAIDYTDPEAPVLAARLQELFGMAETPRIAEGRVPLTVHLLSPARRPVQVTRDLASFWERGYFEVRRDLRGRYPKHPWPDDPRTAEPPRRGRPRER